MCDKKTTITEIAGIKIVKKIKYLGVKISCDRKTIRKDAELACKKYIGYIKDKIQTKETGLKNLIHGAFYRSLIIYFFTPLLGAGLVSKE